MRLSPISTATINPQRDTYCLSTAQPFVLIPILLNNTDPLALRYTLTPLGYSSGSRSRIDVIDLSSRDLKAIEVSRTVVNPTRPSQVSEEDDYDEYDDSEEEQGQAVVKIGQRTLQKTQSVVHVRVSKPGTVKLERVIDASHAEARLSYFSEVSVTPCPQAQFSEPRSSDEIIKCSGEDPEFSLVIDILGVPPLSLKWQKVINGKKQQYVVEGIEGDHPHVSPDSQPTEDPSTAITRRGRATQSVKVPLTVSLDAIGSHQYLLEEITDGVGNVVRIPDVVPLEDSTRSVSLLRRPQVSFRQCAPGQPRTLLIGSEAPLTITTNDADPADAPWEVSFTYQPSEESGKSKLKPYKKTIKTEGSRRDLTLRANAPGEYTLVGVKGQVSRFSH